MIFVRKCCNVRLKFLVQSKALWYLSKYFSRSSNLRRERKIEREREEWSKRAFTVPLPPLLHAPLDELGADKRLCGCAMKGPLTMLLLQRPGLQGEQPPRIPLAQHAAFPACTALSLSAVSPSTLAASFMFPADCYADHQIAKVWKCKENAGKITSLQAVSLSVQSFI